MINVSNEFWQLMQTRTDFKENAEITLINGTVLELSEKDFTISNNSIRDAAGANSIPLGVALARSVQIELMNDDKRFSTYDFFGATVRLYLTFQLSASTEKIEYGFFTVVSPATYGTTVIITAIDDMHKADKEYTTELTFPQNAGIVLEDCCSACDIALSTTEFLNADFEIKEKPSGDYTYRQIIGFIAMIACGNARINRQGYLEILSYDFSFLNEIADGGTYNPWTGGYVADGGTFNPWNNGDVLDGGLYTDKKDYHILYNFKNLKVDTDDVIITGLQTSYSSETEDGTEKTKTILLGKEGYVLKIDNPLIIKSEEMALQMLGEVLIGGRMRKFEGDHIAYPIAEFMDNAFVVDREGNVYGTVLTDIDFTFFGFTTFKNSAENALRNASKYQTPSVQAIIEARKLVAKEKSDREVALKKLSEQLAVSSGLFMTEETQEDDSKIYYMHDKKTLSESMIVWKLTAQAFGISLDGGKTYPYGLTVTGTAILEMIYAIGLNANHITTGIIKDKLGKTLWNLDTGMLQLSPETKITWGQVTGTDDVANKDDIPSDKDTIALIKNNRGTIITKEYIEALKIIAGSVAAENITGTTISGKTFVSAGQKIFRASDFTEEDITIAQQIAIKQIDLTDEYLNKYDLNGDGIISSIDLLRIKKLLLGEVDSYTLDTGIEISGGSKDGCLLKTKNVIIRPDGIRSLNVSCDNISIKNFIETYDVKQTLEANAYVSPYTYYGEFEIPSDWIEIYGEPICVSAIGVAADPVPATLTKDRRYYRISSNSAKVTARITCLKI